MADKNEIANIPQGNGLAIVEAMPEIQRLAKMAVASQYFMGTEKGTPEEILAKASMKIVLGIELGVGPGIALNNIIIVKGNPSYKAGFIAYRIKTSGKYNYRVTDSSEASCTIQFFEDGEPCGTSTYKIEEARRAGLVRDGSAWISAPSDMLFARALTRGARRYCPDVFFGSAYTPDEIHNSGSGETGDDIPDAEYTVSNVQAQDGEPSADDLPKNNDGELLPPAEPEPAGAGSGNGNGSGYKGGRKREF